MNAPRGAVYIPSGTWNAYQFWRNYDPVRTRRELGYASQLHLDALRLWLSYEFWCESPELLRQRLDDLLGVAETLKLRIMPSLFENCGVDATPATLNDTDPRTAVCVTSPPRAVVADPPQWGRPLEFVRWFMDHYRHDDRLLAIELMNEPSSPRFARALLREADRRRGTVPLTMGCMYVTDKLLSDNLFYLDCGLDVLQIHDNFPPTVEAFRAHLARAAELQSILGKPVWLTEWQRVVPGNAWAPDQPLPAGAEQPAYATLADAVRESGLGSFFWSLMYRPAYLPVMRRKGLFNGVFQADGTVRSETDAQAIRRLAVPPDLAGRDV